MGTGRFAIPVTAGGFDVVGIDISAGMLTRLRSRKGVPTAASLTAARADAVRMPFRDASFDAIYWVHVLHLIPQWRRALDEIVRVVRPGGLLIMARTEGGPDIGRLSREYDRLIRAQGYPYRIRGVRSRPAILRALRQRGARVVRRSRTWSWRDTVTVRTALKFLRNRVYTRTRAAPLRAHRAAMRKLTRWAIQQYGDLDHEESVKGTLRYTVALRGARAFDRIPPARNAPVRRGDPFRLRPRPR